MMVRTDNDNRQLPMDEEGVAPIRSLDVSVHLSQ
jgi:hypothetical protein